MSEIIGRNRKLPHNFFLNGSVIHPHGINRFTIYWKKDNENELSPKEYLEKMHDAGINSLRIVIPGELERGVEPELGKYNSDFLKPVDNVFEIAADLNIYIIVCLFDYASFWTPWDSKIWNQGIYSTRFPDVKEFFTSKELRRYEKGRLEFLVDHFQKYSNVFAWEVMNEMNYLGKFFGDDCENITMDWFDDMAKHIRNVDNNHLITGSLWGEEFWPSLFNHQLNDVIQIHTYDEVLNPEKIANNLEKYLQKAKPFNKPIIIGEFSSKKNNPRRAEFVEAALRSAQRENASAWLYASIWDEFGDMNDELFEVFKRTQPLIN